MTNSTGQRGELRLRSINKSFGGLRALSDVNLTVAGEGITALIGPNGAGKTTLFNVVSGFGRPYAGEITFGDATLTGMPPHQVARQRIARTFQTPVRFPSLTVIENLAVASTLPALDNPFAAIFLSGRDRRSLTAAFTKAESLLAEAGIEHLAESYTSDLSPGNLKLVEIVRQLATSPRMLLLDEPAAAMAVDQIATLTHLVRQIADQGVSVLVIDHNLGFVFDLADTVHVLESGKVLASGPPMW